MSDAGPLDEYEAEKFLNSPKTRRMLKKLQPAGPEIESLQDFERHPLYRKTMQRTKKLYVHDEQNDLNVGDRVRVQECRPLSKLKRWRLVEVLERAR